jgi:hypothetical protein
MWIHKFVLLENQVFIVVRLSHSWLEHFFIFRSSIYNSYQITYCQTTFCVPRSSRNFNASAYGLAYIL